MAKPPGQVSSIFLVIAAALAVLFLLPLRVLSIGHYAFLVIALLAFLVAFFRTGFALCILIFAMLFSPEIGAGGIPGRSVVIRLEDLLLIVIFFGWLAKMAVNKEIGFIRVNALNRPIAVYVFACCLSSLLGVWRGEILPASSFFYLFKYLEYFLLFFMVANNLKDERQAKLFVTLLLVTCFLACLYGLRQIPGGERVTAPFEGGDGGEPNTFAGYLLLMMALIIGFILHTPFRRQGLFLIGFLGLAGIVFLYTLSRGGWMGFFPMLAVVGMLCRRRRLALVITLCIGALVVPYMLPQKVNDRVRETFVQDKSYKVLGFKISLSESAAARVDSWKVGLDKWVQRPFFGWGIPGGNVIDNQYMRVLTETGAFGMSAFLWLIAAIFTSSVRVYRRMEGDGFAQAVSMGLAAGLVGILIQAFGTADFILIRVMEPFWFVAAIVVLLPELKAQATGEGNALPA